VGGFKNAECVGVNNGIPVGGVSDKFLSRNEASFVISYRTDRS
jgi:hypothetical protein